MKLNVANIDSPVGMVVVVTGDCGLCAVGFEDQWREMEAGLKKRFGTVELTRDPGRSGVARNVKAYIDGNLRALDGIEVDPGGTPFQRKVWARLRRVPCGRTVSYAQLAQAIGRPKAVRAVAMANARNPIAIVIPCHRVIGSDGSLRGYGGGVHRKRWLLEHEGWKRKKPARA